MPNVEKILKSFGIKTIIDGQVTEKCVGVCCPFCPEGDDGFHLGVFKDYGNFTCWKCGTKGSLFLLLRKLVGISYSAYGKVLADAGFVDIGTDPVKKVQELLNPKQVTKRADDAIPELPPTAKPIIKDRKGSLLSKFLHRRRYTLQDCIDHRCWITPIGIAPWGLRLIIPIFDKDGHYVAYQGRDLTNRAKERYKTVRGFGIKRHLYGVEHPACHMHLVVVEGVFDQWRMGPGVVATFGTSLSESQLLAIINLKPQRVTLFWDADAKIKSFQAASHITPFVNDVRVAIPFEDRDPDDMGSAEAWTAVESAEKL